MKTFFKLIAIVAIIIVIAGVIANKDKQGSQTEAPASEPSTGSAPTTGPKDATAQKVDLSKIILVTGNNKLTELQKESQTEPYSGYISVTGHIGRIGRSPTNKNHLQIFLYPLDAKSHPDIRCYASQFDKIVMDASPGDKIKITGSGKYEPMMMSFTIRDAKAELIQ